MDKKNLLVVGNKIDLPNYNGYYISLKLYNQAIQNMDYVCRINRMHNYNVTTGVKTDGLYIGGWSDFIQQYRGGEHTDVIKTVKDIYVDVRAWNGGFDRKCREFITDELFNTITICPFAELKKNIGYAFPCSVILMIDYFASTKPWCDEYNIWVTGIDIDNRSDVIKTGFQWQKNGHINGADYEQQYLQKMLEEGKIHWLDKELCELYSVQKHVPILITVKSYSTRCSYKNETLLPYTLDYIKSIGRIEDAVIISDSNNYRHIAKVYNVKYYVENRPEDGSEFTAIKQYLDANQNITEFIYLPVTQPCRDQLLVDKALLCEHDGLVTSYVRRANRDIYKLNSDMQFEIKDTERKGVMCKEEMIADGAIYYMSTEFFNRAYLSENMNKAFWNTNTKFIENEAPFVDIDTNDDLLQYIKYYVDR